MKNIVRSSVDTRLRRYIFLAGALLCGGTNFAVSQSPTSATPTYNQDVAVLLNRHCVRCHRSGGIAVALTDYDAAKRAGSAIKKQVLARTMPPWPADPKHSLPFAHDPQLSQQEIEIFAAWVEAGMPRGAGSAPPPPEAASIWGHPGQVPPDVVIPLPEVTVPANGEIPYVIRRVKVPLAQDRWVTAMQVLPGNPALVHHMGITEITLANRMTAQDAEAFAKLAQQLGAPPDALDATTPTVSDPANGNAYDMLGVYTPGSTFEMYADGSGKLIKAGADNYINFNVHYTTIGIVAHDQSRLALWFAKSPPAHQLIRTPAAVETILANGRQLLADDPGTPAEGAYVAIPAIPAYAQNYELVGMTAYTRPVTLYQLQPHAHMRGKDFTYLAIYPDGGERSILSIPHYDFHWQLAYELKTPLRLPAGSKLVVVAHYDNSSQNPHLRDLGQGDLAKNCGPDKVAYFRRQNQSWHEMFSPIVQYSVDALPAHQAGSRLIQLIGCIGGGAGHWTLEHASSPAATATQSTSAREAAEYAARPLGNGHYALIGARFFGPERQQQNKVVVKGVLSNGAPEARLNVTSLQAAGACPVM